MEMFWLTSGQLLMIFILMLAGFLLRKTGILPESAVAVMSKLETYVFLPALNFSSQLANCTPHTFKENSQLLLYGTVTVGAAVLLAYPLSALFIKNAKTDKELSYRRNIYKYAFTFGNYGFMGSFIVLELFGSEGLFKYSLFYFVMTVVCNTWGVYLLIPKEDSGKMSKNLIKGLTSPPTVSLVAGCLGGLAGLGDYVPDFLSAAMNNAADCMGPVAMLLAGAVIGGYGTKQLLSEKRIYAASLLRLVVIPSVLLLALHLFGTDKEIIFWTLIAFAAPFGLNTIVFPATYGAETRTGASMALISHVLSVVTLPVMYYIFIVLL